jgi:hypothetical protein
MDFGYKVQLHQLVRIITQECGDIPLLAWSSCIPGSGVNSNAKVDDDQQVTL